MPTTIKAALKKWEEATGRKSGDSKEIKLIGVYPPIEKVTYFCDYNNNIQYYKWTKFRGPGENMNSNGNSYIIDLV